jgi:hypothetical protein
MDAAPNERKDVLLADAMRWRARSVWQPGALGPRARDDAIPCICRFPACYQLMPSPPNCFLTNKKPELLLELKGATLV